MSLNSNKFFSMQQSNYEENSIVINKKDNIGNSSFNESIIKKELNELVDAGLTLSAASKYLAKKNNIKKSLIYNLY